MVRGYGVSTSECQILTGIGTVERKLQAIKGFDKALVGNLPTLGLPHGWKTFNEDSGLQECQNFTPLGPLERGGQSTQVYEFS